MPTERKAPDAIAASTNLTGAVSAIQDDPDSPDANWLTATSATAVTDCRVTFPTPTGDPSGSQNFRLQLRKTTGTPNPTVDIQLYQGGTLRTTPVNDQAISSTGGTVVQADWASTDLSGTVDGSDVECRVVSTVGTAIGALPAYGAAGTLLDSATLARTDSVLNSPAHVAGDLLVVLVACRNNDQDGVLTSVNAGSGTSGWTLDNNSGNMYGGAWNIRLGFGWKIATSASEVCSISATGGNTFDRIHARVYKFTAANGFDSSAVQDVGGLSTGTLSASQDMIMPDISGGGANELALCLYGLANTSTQDAPTGESGGDWTEPVGEDATTNCTSGIFIADDSDQGGLSGGTSASGSTSTTWAAIRMHLVPNQAVNTNTVEIGAIEWNVTYTAGGATVVVPAASLALAGAVPVIKTGAHPVIPAASLALSGAVPSIRTGAHVIIPAPSGFALSGASPVIKTGASVAVPAGALALAGVIPSIRTGAAPAVPAGVLALAGVIPSIRTGAVVTVPAAIF